MYFPLRLPLSSLFKADVMLAHAHILLRAGDSCMCFFFFFFFFFFYPDRLAQP